MLAKGANHRSKPAHLVLVASKTLVVSAAQLGATRSRDLLMGCIAF